ncbi:hypothetical protein [Streptomyces buecherae]|uniref:hypothetical protein n=1 Tax=Streptomyces buecherae TaxID=2763006 RepID=UPI0036474C3C
MPKTKTPAQLAGTAAEAIRALNHVTLNSKALPYPPHVSETVQALVAMVDRLPQALQQISGAVRRHAEHGLIRMDDGTDPAKAAGEVSSYLADAIDDVDKLSVSLHVAASVLFHMGTAEKAEVH